MGTMNKKELQNIADKLLAQVESEEAWEILTLLKHLASPKGSNKHERALRKLENWKAYRENEYVLKGSHND